MRTVRIAFVLLFITLFSVVANSIALTGIITDIRDKVKAAPDDTTDAAYDEYSEIYSEYNEYSSYISLTVNHEDLRDIENSFAEIIGAAKADDTEALLTIKSRLIGALEHLRRLSGINLDSIF